MPAQDQAVVHAAGLVEFERRKIGEGRGFGLTRVALSTRGARKAISCYQFSSLKNCSAVEQVAALSSSSEQPLTCAATSEISFTYAGSQRLPR